MHVDVRGRTDSRAASRLRKSRPKPTSLAFSVNGTAGCARSLDHALSLGAQHEVLFGVGETAVRNDGVRPVDHSRAVRGLPRLTSRLSGPMSAGEATR